MVRPTKQPDPANKRGGPAECGRAENGREEGDAGVASSAQQGTADRRVLRSRYLAVKHLISDKRDDIAGVDSGNFNSIITEVESLHELVQKPREQVADAEALLDIANTLVTSVKSQANEGITPSDFVNALLKKHGEVNGGESTGNTIHWSNLGCNVAYIFRNASGCSTMIGPMGNELKQRKAVVQRKRTRPTESRQPEELADTGTEVKTDTDKNMSTMFDILRRKKSVKLENLVLNRESFAQTVENIFALSFLVKEGRAEMTVNSNGQHIISPRNAPAASAVASGEVSYSHFVFRFDFKDWKLMIDNVAVGKELMPHRNNNIGGGASTSNSNNAGEESQAPATPIKKLTRNRGLIIQEASIVDESLETATATKNGKRKHLFL
ncbi:non-structural maintenance of chromosomes element 4 homolog A-like isoform X2 [Zingiber officinale]|uniref:non-structural maintenance of chromosomes element 4 homolog A-like isoform X2 n=1 Tax=Zingiber officinale TaxID=94328 RepID=UPI001C4D9D3D|nr:non-structural maintenance of chromosomes element 4 homolog A-like isoform X2 [Zingiber officinale]